MRLIDADALKEFINECKVCDICPNKALNCVIHCDFPDYLTPIWEKVIDSIPTIEDLSEYSDKLWKKAYERGKAEGRPQGEFTIDELKKWLYEIAYNNTNNDFGEYCVEIVDRLDGFKRFVADMRKETENECKNDT